MQEYNTHYFEYIALTKDLVEIADISHYVEDGGSIEYNSLSTLKANCNFNISLAINEKLNLDAIRIYSVLNGAKECLGTFLISSPAADFNNMIQNISCTGYSTLWPLSVNTPSNKYYVAEGTNVIAEVKRILSSLNYACLIPDSVKTTSINREWDIGTSYLTIINDLLDVANYTSLYIDVYGEFQAEEYVLPQDRQPDEIIDEDGINDIEPQQTNELDLFNVPNRFIRYCASDPTSTLYAEYVNTEGPTGTNNTWVNTDVQEVSDAADYDTLYEICKRDCINATSIYNKLSISTMCRIIKTYMPVIRLKHFQANGDYVCTSFTLDLTVGGSSNLNLRKVVMLI